MGNKKGREKQNLTFLSILEPIKELKRDEFVRLNYYCRKNSDQEWGTDIKYAWRFKLKGEPHVVMVISHLGLQLSGLYVDGTESSHVRNLHGNSPERSNFNFQLRGV